MKQFIAGLALMFSIPTLSFADGWVWVYDTNTHHLDVEAIMQPQGCENLTSTAMWTMEFGHMDRHTFKPSRLHMNISGLPLSLDDAGRIYFVDAQ